MPKNFRKLPPAIKRRIEKLAEQNLVAGCSRAFSADEIRSGTLSHLGIGLSSKCLTFPESIVPPETVGKASDRNVNGYVVVRKDLPKETRYNTVEAPNWGDSYNGTHPVDLPYEAYPRDQYAPRLAQITISCADAAPNKPSYTLVFEVDRVFDRKSESFEEDLLEAINLLQENVGACGVQRANATFSDYLKTMTVAWEVLPPGTKEEAVERVFRGRAPSPEERSIVEDRYTFLMGLKPKNLVFGLSGIQRYFGAQLANNLVVFENIEYGNAIYVMFEDWKALSKRSRTELLSGRYGDNFDRVVHKKGWKGAVKSIVKKKLAA